MAVRGVLQCGTALLFLYFRMCCGGSDGPVTVKEAQNSSYAWKPSRPLNYYRGFQTAITSHTCADKKKEALRLPKDIVAQRPEFNKIPTTLIHPNRSDLLHLHNMALSRAFFHSYVLQFFNVSRTDFVNLPGLLYLYMSTVADVSANPKVINGSTLLYDVHKFYPNWFSTLPFNNTFNLFGIRATRIDDTFISENFLREPTERTIRVKDLGAMYDNYTLSSYRFAPWYGKGENDPGFLPDNAMNTVTGGQKQMYRLVIHWDPVNQSSNTFFGPPYAGELESAYLPVHFTEPWFDCGKAGEALNEWAVSSVSPVVDFMPRYGSSQHLLKPEYVAVAAMDTFLIAIPVNLCPISEGNPKPNLVAGSDHCTETMVCEPMLKKRGGQVSQFTASTFYCRCQMGYRYPVYQPGPYPGVELGKKTTLEEKEYGYQCLPIGNKMTWPTEPLTHIGDKTGSVQFTRRKRSIQDDEEEATVEDEDTTETEKRGSQVKPDDNEEKILRKQEEAWFAKVESMERREKLLEWFEARNMSMAEVMQDNEDKMDERPSKLISRYDKGRTTRKPSLVPRFDSNWLPKKSPEIKTKKPVLQSRHRRQTEEKKVNLNLEASDRVDQMLTFINSVNRDTCKNYRPDDLILPGGVSFGADQQFDAEASTALRLAHFLSAFLQNNEGPGAVVGDYRIGQKLHEYHVFGELLANIAGSMFIISSGVFFERNAFVGADGTRRGYFGPLLYRDGELKANSFAARDMAKFGDGYASETWFRVLHERWASNAYGLEKIRVLPWIRPSPMVKYLAQFVKYPLYFRAPRLEDGYWTQPYFDCNGPVPEWLITYAVPFFGSHNGRLTFGGVVTVSVPLRRLNINQCPSAFHEVNFFQNSALCHADSSYCKHVWGQGLRRGSYECHCGQGFEFPFMGRRFFFLGPMIEDNYRKKRRKEPNIFGILKCRQAVGSRLSSQSTFYLLCIISIVHLIKHLFIETS